MADNPFAQYVPKDKTEAVPATNPFNKYIPKEKEAPEPANMEDFTSVDPMGNPTTGALAPAGATLMSTGIGLLKPFAGALQWTGINSPAQKLEELSKASSNIGGTPADIAEFGGQVASPLPIKGANAAEKLLPKVLEESATAKGALQGLGASLFNPTEVKEGQNYGNFLADKLIQASEGTVLGAGLGKVSQALLNPKINSTIKELMDKGINLTPGQILSQIPLVGSSIRNLEHGVANIPIGGGPVQSAIEKSYGDFNKSVGNEILSNINETLPENIKPGHDMIRYIQGKLNDAYKFITNNARISEHFDPNEYTSDRINNALNDAISDLTPDTQREVSGFVRRNIVDHIANTVDMTGKQFRAMEKSLSDKTRQAFESGDTNAGEAYKKVLEDLRAELEFQNESIADKLKQTHSLFRAFKPVENSAAKHTDNNGIFSPSTLKSEIEKDIGTSQAAAGTSPMADMAGKATSVLGEKLPGKEYAIGAAANLLNPIGSIIGALSTGLVYNKPITKLMNLTATSRPDVLRNAEPAISKGLARTGATAVSIPPPSNPQSSVDVYGLPPQNYKKGGRVQRMNEGGVPDFEGSWYMHPDVQRLVANGDIPAGDARWMSDYAQTKGDSRVETGGEGWKDQSEKMRNFVGRMERGEIPIPKHMAGEGGVSAGGNSSGLNPKGIGGSRGGGGGGGVGYVPGQMNPFNPDSPLNR